MAPIGPLTRAFLTHCGYPEKKINAWDSSTRLFQDVGLAGDSALEEFEILHRVFGVDLSDFSFHAHFPTELSKDLFIVNNFRWTKLSKKISGKYKEINFETIEKCLAAKKWIY